MRAPRTVFSTDLRGGKRAAKARLRHLFAPRRRGLPPLALALAAVVLTAGLVACRPSAGQEPAASFSSSARSFFFSGHWQRLLFLAFRGAAELPATAFLLL